MATPATVTYEQPLSERMRVFLRLENLFHATREGARSHAEWAGRATLENLNEIARLLARSELKQEIIRELERHQAQLERLRGNPDVDESRLLNLLSELDHQISKLHDVRGQLGHELRRNEFLTQVRQRSQVPGGAREFDMPSLHFWLSRPAEQRYRRINEWLDSVSRQEEAVGIILKLLRERAQPIEAVAEGGTWRRNLDGQVPCELIRIVLDAALSCYPEISGSRHRVSVRFMAWSGDERRPVQTNENVKFTIYCCGA